MTRLEELEALETDVLTCAQVGLVLKANPATIHYQAMECPEKLGFPVIVMGSRVRIPKGPFILFLRGKEKGPDAGTPDPIPYEGEKDQTIITDKGDNSQ